MKTFTTSYRIHWMSARGRGCFDTSFDKHPDIQVKLALRAWAKKESQKLHTPIEKEFPATVVQSHDNIISISLVKGERAEKHD